MQTKLATATAGGAFLCLLIAGSALAPLAKAANAAKLDAISGVVKSAKGPEAGVWVIAETKDLPTRYIKIVVTDDQGRYLLPQLPKAKYKVWVRGYGLVDSDPVQSTPGSNVDLKAKVAPNAAAAAQYYPADYWFAMVKPPAKNEFPGTGHGGNGIAPDVKTQQHWIAQMKECLQCHQVGDQWTREIGNNTPEGWDQRTQLARDPGDPSIGNDGKGYMNTMHGYETAFGPERAGKMWAAWTQAIAKGALPKKTPPRPSGIERNVVLTLRDWGQSSYFHDEVASDRRDPNVNAGGPIYGIETNLGKLGILDPVKNTFSEIDVPKGYQGFIHTVMMDGKGRIWMNDGGPAYQPDAPKLPVPNFCFNEKNKFAAYSPRKGSGNVGFIDVYDPKTKKMTNIPACIGVGHIWFGYDKDNTAFFTSKEISWIDTKVWDETHDPAKAEGWCPFVIDTKEKGFSKAALGGGSDVTIDPDPKNWNLPGKIPDPHKDTRIYGGTYGLGVSPVDNTVWASVWDGASKNYPGGIVRLDRGNNPPQTCKTEFYEPPKLPDGTYAAFASHDLNIDSKGIAWVSFTSGQIGRFDRSKCKELTGPKAIGQQCSEGWEIFDSPSPHFTGTNDKADNADYLYQTFVDRFDTFGLGKDTPIYPSANSDALYAFQPATKKWVTIRVPYPMGFYSRWLDGRIDNPNAGWSGKGVWATYATVPTWHQEGGVNAKPELVHFQLRPDPLAD